MAGFPGVIGAIDGCHIEIKAPEETQADFLDRTCTHSINLMAVCTADKKFTHVNAGFPGSAHDNRVFESTDLYTNICTSPTTLFPHSFYHIIGDKAFKLSKYLLTPYKDEGRLNAIQKKI